MKWTNDKRLKFTCHNVSKSLSRVYKLCHRGEISCGFSVSTSESEDQVESGLLLDVVVRKGSAILELLSSEDESLLIWRNTFLVLDLSLHVFNGVGWLDVEGDGLSGKGLDEDLHLKLFKDFIFYCFPQIKPLNTKIIALNFDKIRLKNQNNVAITLDHR